MPKEKRRTMQETSEQLRKHSNNTPSQWEPLSSQFRVETSTPKHPNQNDVPFYIPEKNRRMNRKNVVDNDFVITVYMPKDQLRQHQSTIHGPSSDTPLKRGNTTKASNLFKTYSYRSTEMPTSLQSSSSSSSYSSSMDSQSDSKDPSSPIPLCFNNSPIRFEPRNMDQHLKPKKLEKDVRHSLPYILHPRNQEIDKRWNPFV